MARVEVTSGNLSDGRIQQLSVRLSGLPPRTLTRDQALAWMRDGHSFIPLQGGTELPALQLLEIPKDEPVDGALFDRFIRHDTRAEAADSLPFDD